MLRYSWFGSTQNQNPATVSRGMGRNRIWESHETACCWISCNARSRRNHKTVFPDIIEEEEPAFLLMNPNTVAGFFIRDSSQGANDSI